MVGVYRLYEGYVERKCCKPGKWKDGTGVPKREAGKRMRKRHEILVGIITKLQGFDRVRGNENKEWSG